MSTILEGLLAQAEAAGTPRLTLQAIAEEAAQAGATRALERLGLKDGDAGADIVELRQLVQGWRDARKSALKALIGWAVRTVMALLIFAIAFKLGLIEGQGA